MTDFKDRKKLGDALAGAIERAGPAIEALCASIYAHPEPAFAEEHAVAQLTAALSGYGYEVETNMAGLPTAFQATLRNFDSEAMRKGLRHGHVAILAEYDADEDGHRSGRHLVAGAALATAIGLAEALKGVYGQVTIVGCPAATNLQGKRLLADAGLFEPFDAALGALPASTGLGFQPIINSSGNTLASARMQVAFAGEADTDQRFATDAEAVDGIKATRTDAGVTLDLLSASNPNLDASFETVRTLAESIAADTGSTASVDVIERTPAMAVNRALARRLKTFTDSLNLRQDMVQKRAPSEPTDWGHVSLVTSTVQAMYPLSEDAGTELVVGTSEFEEASTSDFAQQQVRSIATALGLIGLDLLGDMEFRGFAEGELIRTVKAQGLSRTPRRWLGVHPVIPRESANGQVPATGSPTPGKGTT